MRLFIAPNGNVQCLYGEELDLRRIGKMAIHRASHVEPTSDGLWMADMSPVEGPLLGPFALRSDALAAEEHWIECHWGPPVL
jgi:hypothetical protein